MASKELFHGEMYFSYNQFMVYDKSTDLPACAWTQEHSDQGFARRASTVCFGTLLEYGTATVTVYLASPPPRLDRFERVIAVSLSLPSGTVAVDGPDEYPIERIFQVPAGHYRLTAAQRRWNDKEEGEEIELFLERISEPDLKSEILIADAGITRTTNLVETADVA